MRVKIKLNKTLGGKICVKRSSSQFEQRKQLLEANRLDSATKIECGSPTPHHFAECRSILKGAFNHAAAHCHIRRESNFGSSMHLLNQRITHQLSGEPVRDSTHPCISFRRRKHGPTVNS